jgi:RNA recognition motif-containing protein
MKLIVLNLPRDFTEEALEELFLPNGKIAACSIVTDEETGTSKGFGFVEMAYKKDARFAIKRLHNSTLDGKRIRVKPADRTETGSTNTGPTNTGSADTEGTETK